MQATRALFEAIRQNSITAVRTQIALGADLDARNADGQTPVGLAVSLRYTTIAELLNRSRVMQRAAEESAVPLRAPTVKVLRAGQSRTGNAPPVRDTKIVTDENGVAIYEGAREEQISKPAQPNTAFPSTLVWPPAPDFVTSVDGRRVPTDPSANVFSFDSPPDRVTAAPVSSVTAEPVAPAPARMAPPGPTSSADPVHPASSDDIPKEHSGTGTGLSPKPDNKTPATAEPVTAQQEKPARKNGPPEPQTSPEPSILERLGNLFSAAEPVGPPSTPNSVAAKITPESPAAVPAIKPEPAPLRIAEPVDATNGLDPAVLAQSLNEPVQPATADVVPAETAVAEVTPATVETTTPVHASPADFIASLGNLLAPEPAVETTPAAEAEPVTVPAEKPVVVAKSAPELSPSPKTPEVLDRPLDVQSVMAETAEPQSGQRIDLLDVIGKLFTAETSGPADTLAATETPASLSAENAAGPASPNRVSKPAMAEPSVLDAVAFTPQNPEVLAQTEAESVSVQPVATPVATVKPTVAIQEVPEPDFFNRVASLFSFGSNKDETPETEINAEPEVLASQPLDEKTVTKAVQAAVPETRSAPKTAFFPGEKKIVAGAWPPAPTEPTAPPPPMPRQMVPETASEDVVQTASLEVGPAPSRELPLPAWTTAPAVEPRTFAFSELMHLGHRRDIYDAEDTKCLKYVYRHKKERIRACVVNVTWPREIRPDFVANSIIYTGQKAVVIYQDGIAAAMYALFRSDAFERISGYLASQYGPTTDYSRDKVQLMAGGRRQNEISLWRGTDPASGLAMEMEVRKFDNVRDLFGDPYHGMIEIRFAESRRVFQFVQPLDLMTNR
ncbi:hypothetical protein GH722_08300 [Alphaproteobacteria bacterium HT1-32]|nr:hypothetical protein [Alphaproteobacteria bacterium HT1-32]